MFTQNVVALLRDVPDSMGDCELTWQQRATIDIDLARQQHRAYAQALRDAGLQVLRLPADPAFPDCNFVEDIAMDVGGVLILTSPGADSRRGERPAVLEALRTVGDVIQMPDDMRLDGGDVIHVRNTLFVGLSKRSGRAAMDWLEHTTGCRVVGVELDRVLHLKTGMTALDEDTLLCAPGAVDTTVFSDFDVLETEVGDEHAANALRLPPREPGDRRLLMSGGFTRTIDRVRGLGYEVNEVDISQFALAEASMTCMSVLLGARW